MKDYRDDKLDGLLRARRIEPASSDLAQRIIFKAHQVPQNRNPSLWQWVRQLCAEFHLPKPAYVFASALIFGMVLGFSLPPDTHSSAEDSSASIPSIFSANEALL
jgi:hypothetical protein